MHNYGSMQHDTFIPHYIVHLRQNESMLALRFLWFVLATSTTVIPLRTEADLKAINECLTCQYVLLADITSSGPWMPIGTSSTPFAGSFDGQGRSITLSSFGVTTEDTVGLFGVVKNAQLLNVRLFGNGDDWQLPRASHTILGLLAGRAYESTIYGCSVSMSGLVSATGTALTVGGLFGAIVRSTIERCYANLSLVIAGMDQAYVGGMVGNITNSSITGCEVNISILARTTTSAHVGGLIGVSAGATVTIVSTCVSFESQNQRPVDVVGGLTGLDIRRFGRSLFTSSTVQLKIRTVPAINFAAGGFAGVSDNSLSLTQCSAMLQLEGATQTIAKRVTIGGAIGQISQTNASIADVYVNVTISIPPQSASIRLAYVGGLVALAIAENTTVVQSVAIVTIDVVANVLAVGGIVGTCEGVMMTIQNTGALGNMSVTALKPNGTNVGGILGKAVNTFVTQCYFIGSVQMDGTGSVGALAAVFYSAKTRSAYALANVSATGANMTVGFIGQMTRSVLEYCYGAVNISAGAMDTLILGGMVGFLGSGSQVDSSFVMESLVVSELANNTTVGGFVGIVDGDQGNESIMLCYAWGTVSVGQHDTATVVLGGLVGAFNGTTILTSSIAYVDMSANVRATAGLLAGSLGQRSVSGTGLEDSTSISFVVVYVQPGGSLTGVRLVGANTSIVVSDSYCAQYPNTDGCTPLKTLNTWEFLKNFDFMGTVQLSSGAANGSLSFLSVPSPTSGSTAGTPRLVMPDPEQFMAWSPDTWSVKEEVLNGVPYLRTIVYTQYCGPQVGCHGAGSSPVDAVCASGWSSSPRNETTVTDNLHHCNIFLCQSDTHCHRHGSCSSGQCVCNSGYTGTDCSQTICPELDGVVCGGERCLSFTASSHSGVCSCARTEFLVASGLCVTGCPVIGQGVCENPGNPSCIAGYSTANFCLQYDCSAVATGACNEKGQCTDGKCVCAEGRILLGGNCYTPCNPGVAVDCLTVNCGKTSGCSGRGLCVPSLQDNTASCTCNIDAAGRTTGTHFGGPFCETCEAGYKAHAGDCVADRCPACDGGECKYNATENAIVCTCAKNYVPIDDQCFRASCGKCSKGECIPIPNGADPQAFFCICNTGVADGSCYFFECHGCQGGTCVPDKSTMKVQCVCPNGSILNPLSGACDVQNSSRSTLTIILCVVIIGGAVVAAITATLCILRKRKRLLI